MGKHLYRPLISIEGKPPVPYDNNAREDPWL